MGRARDGGLATGIACGSSRWDEGGRQRGALRLAATTKPLPELSVAPFTDRHPLGCNLGANGLSSSPRGRGADWLSEWAGVLWAALASHLSL